MTKQVLTHIKRKLPKLSNDELLELERQIQALKHEREIDTDDQKYAQPGNLMRTVLQGTNYNISEAEKAALVKRARLLGVQSGYHEDWQLMQFGHAVVENRDAHWRHILNKRVFPLLAAATRLDALIESIVDYVQRTPGKMWSETPEGNKLYPYTAEDAGDLSKYSVDAVILASGLKIPYDMIPNPKAFISGIKGLINGEDDGLALRNAVNQWRPPSKTLLEYLDNIKPPGAPQGPHDFRIWLRDAWLDYEREHPQADPATVRLALRNRLATWDKETYILNEGYREDEKFNQALESLTGTTAKNRPAQYRKRLIDL